MSKQTPGFPLRNCWACRAHNSQQATSSKDSCNLKSSLSQCPWFPQITALPSERLGVDLGPQAQLSGISSWTCWCVIPGYRDAASRGFGKRSPFQLSAGEQSAAPHHQKLFSPCQGFAINSLFTLTEVNYHICCDKVYTQHVRWGKIGERVILN